MIINILINVGNVWKDLKIVNWIAFTNRIKVYDVKRSYHNKKNGERGSNEKSGRIKKIPWFEITLRCFTDWDEIKKITAKLDI